MIRIKLRLEVGDSEQPIELVEDTAFVAPLEVEDQSVALFLLVGVSPPGIADEEGLFSIHPQQARDFRVRGADRMGQGIDGTVDQDGVFGVVKDHARFSDQPSDRGDGYYHNPGQDIGFKPAADPLHPLGAHRQFRGQGDFYSFPASLSRLVRSSKPRTRPEY